MVTEGVRQGEIIKVKQFNRIGGYLLSFIKSKIHFENGEWIWFTCDWPLYLTVGCVKQIRLNFIPTSDIPVIDKRSVICVEFWPPCNYDLMFLQQFKRLKQLLVWGKGTSSLTTPSLPFLEELEMQSTNVIIKTENLRELKISYTIIDESTAAFISRQSRLLVLCVYEVYNAPVVNFPSTIKRLFWKHENGQDTELHALHLTMQCASLNLREFKTNVELKTINWLNTQKIKTWEVNDVIREKKEDKWVLTIYGSFNTSLLSLNRKADKCLVWENDILALNFVDKATPSLTICRELKGKCEEVSVLEAVIDLIVKYKVSEDQAKLLGRVFPQFTEAELMDKEEKK